MTYFARQRTFDGRWTPTLSAENPHNFVSVKSGVRAIKDVTIVPPEALRLSLNEIDDVMPGGRFHGAWEDRVREFNP